MNTPYYASVVVISTGLRLSAQEAPTSLPPDSAYAHVLRLNGTRRLLPQSEWWFGRQLEDLRSSSCFGVVLPGGLRLVGESGGRDYGIQSFTVDASGKSVATVLIGVFHAEFPFAIEGKPFLKGSYLVWARPDSLVLTGDDTTIARTDNRGRAFPRETRVAFRLASALPDSVVAEKAVRRPRAVVEVKDRALVLRVWDHAFPIAPRL